MTAYLYFTRVNLTGRVISVLAALALAFSLLPAATAASAANCRAQHTVQRGETLYKIGLKYNLTWDKIAEANGIANPNKIYAGQVLCIPVSSSSTPPSGSVQYVQALTDVNIRKGPGLNYGVIEILRAGQTAKVTGKSADGNWWRVICPDGTIGECYVTAGSKYTQPANPPGGSPPKPTPIATPTFRISAVVRDQTVTISTANFPANQKFDVRMGLYGTAGINGTYVTTIDSGNGGAFSQSFSIPANLRGLDRIAIRLDSASGHFAYNWFWNNSTN